MYYVSAKPSCSKIAFKQYVIYAIASTQKYSKLPKTLILLEINEGIKTQPILQRRLQNL